VNPAQSEPGRASLDEQPWWTEADRRELKVHVREFVDVAWEHKRCRICAGGWCPVVQEAFQRLLDWRSARILISKAEWARTQQNARR
jgi:hypothetical protein